MFMAILFRATTHRGTVAAPFLSSERVGLTSAARRSATSTRVVREIREIRAESDRSYGWSRVAREPRYGPYPEDLALPKRIRI